MSGGLVNTTTAIILAAGKGTRMRSDLPKVLHEVDGVPMITRSVRRARAAGIEGVTVVVGYRGELIRAALGGEAVSFVDQEQQLGTGHAVIQAREAIESASGSVVILYGDMPLLSPRTIERLVRVRQESSCAAVLLTVVLDAPPDFGRIIRDDAGRVVKVVEVKDATAEQLDIHEVNVGAYCFAADALLSALDLLRADNAQGEYYLTDVIELMADEGLAVATVVTDALEETLGVNDPLHLEFAGKLGDIQYAESLYELIDATLAMRRASG
jgi:bifunctional UDP-N-acetylglucosamine pyrophosphorylase / glucosamine-1-phosphate N-acetyltransferase